MQNVVIPQNVGADMERVLNHIFSEAMGNPIKFEEAPSLSDLNPNSWGFSGTDVYLRFSDGTGIKLIGVAL